MKTQSTLLVVALVLGMSINHCRSADRAPLAPSPTPPQWEHLALTQELRPQPKDSELSRKIVELGRQGWELTSVVNFQENGTTTKTVYYFKRRLS